VFDWIITVRRINNPVWFGSEDRVELRHYGQGKEARDYQAVSAFGE
jgi:hypothetical protein